MTAEMQQYIREQLALEWGPGQIQGRLQTGKPDPRGQVRCRIEARPGIVDEKKRIGDWGADTVLGKGHKGVLVTLSERVSKLNLIAQVPPKHAEVVTQAIIEMLTPYQDDLHTITFDNGKEFAFHDKISQAIDVNSYFSRPYRSWERGLNENTNGLLRQYWPKSTDLKKISANDVTAVIINLNDRPRKTLGYKTPARLMAEHMAAIAA